VSSEKVDATVARDFRKQISRVSSFRRAARHVWALGMRYERLNVEDTWTIVVRQPGML